MRIIHNYLLAIALVVMALAPAARASAVGELFLTDDFTFDQDKFRGTWKQSKRWSGRLCDGSYSYGIGLNGKVEKLDFNMTEEGHIEAYGDLTDIFGSISGSYRSAYSLCVPLKSRLSAEIERFEVNAKVWFIEKGDKLEIKLRIYRTKIHRVYFSKYLPNWFENFLTGILDRAINYVWKTTLGDWINEKITEKLKEKFPDGISMDM